MYTYGHGLRPPPPPVWACTLMVMGCGLLLLLFGHVHLWSWAAASSSASCSGMYTYGHGLQPPPPPVRACTLIGKHLQLSLNMCTNTDLYRHKLCKNPLCSYTTRLESVVSDMQKWHGHKQTNCLHRTQTTFDLHILGHIGRYSLPS